jgi:preprotein translocase subunit SecE
MAKNDTRAPSANIFSGLREEFKQVTWPTRKEALELTVTVVTISLIVALFVGIIDVLLAKILAIIAK